MDTDISQEGDAQHNSSSIHTSPNAPQGRLLADPCVIALGVAVIFYVASLTHLLPGVGIWHAVLDMALLICIGGLLLYKAYRVAHTRLWAAGRRQRVVLDACLLLLMGSLLFYGASWQMFKAYTDAAKYNCYALAFWQGLDAVKTLPPAQCEFIFRPVTFDQVAAPQAQQHVQQPPSLLDQAEQYGVPASWVHQLRAWQPTLQPLHTLPNEYPLPVLLPFSLGLLAPQGWYQVSFAIWMVLLAGLLCYLLARYRSREAATSCAFYLITGCWATAAGRFDLLPALFTLLAVVYAARSRWGWAFAYLALATLCKFYPVLLLLPFLLQQQRLVQGNWRAWQRWLPLVVFGLVCAGIVVVSLLFSVEGTLKPLTYFGDRPIQVESLPASLMWLTSLVAGLPLTFKFTYGSLNMFGAPVQIIGSLSTPLLLVGLAYTYWLQWRGKIDLAASSLLTLLLLIGTSKVFSPQYLIWVAPLVAYVGQANWRWMVSWGLLGVLTTLIYPYIYISVLLQAVPQQPIFFPIVTIRNFILAGFIIALLIAGQHGQFSARSQEHSLAALS
jgi:hypothetical protein